MVPKWQEAYMDYNSLKTLLKELHGFQATNQTNSCRQRRLESKDDTLQSFSGLTQRYNNNNSGPLTPSSPDIEDQQPILVNSVSRNGSQSYQTAFLMQADEGGEYELVFFRRLGNDGGSDLSEDAGFKLGSADLVGQIRLREENGADFW
ncbi:hypothetical protein CCACVL1_10084 [Corchorus capsularis]|uniref:SPX domain-containing protein n=1 Tax=Corchorus capsularis TaxID=210143 RepID=A0A1R3ISQ6_COCAP|nr:hypothetical protein CCACVL1_10084 [Corchorus capsularis]